MEFSKQHHIQQDPDHLNIHWDTLTICQLNCSYCYARNEYGDKWGKLMSKENINRCVEAFGRSSLSFNLGLLGGEPTLGPHYFHIIEKVSELKNNQKIYVTTNGYKDLTNHPKFDNVAFLFSYHPADIVDEELFFRNVQSAIDKGIQTKVNVMLHHNKALWDKIKTAIFRFLDMGAKVHPHFLYTHSSRMLFHYRKDFWEYFKFLEEVIPKELVYDDQLFNDYEIFHNGMTVFTGWSCWNNNYEVDVYGNVVQFCKDRTTGSNLLTDPDYFKRITETKAMICPHKACNCDGLLKQLKIKNNAGI